MTVLVVSLDGADLTKAHRILISKTFTDKEGKESPDIQVSLEGLLQGVWTVKAVRPGGYAPLQVENRAGLSLTLPSTGWHECELELQ